MAGVILIAVGVIDLARVDLVQLAVALGHGEHPVLGVEGAVARL